MTKNSDLINIPEELKKLNCFLLWKLEKRNDKYTKTPYQIDSKMAKVNNKNTWSNFINVMRVIDKFSGVGFVFDISHNYIGIDIDHCIDKDINEKAEHWIKMFNSYTEISQSGTGIHIIVKLNDKTELQKHVKEIYGNETGIKKDRGECYFTGRYFALTGNIYNNMSKINTTKLSYIKDFLRYISEDKKPIENHNRQINTYDKLSDNEIISLADRFNNNFSYLYNETGQKGNSEGDQSLINILCFYTKDPGQIKRIMLNSPRSRDKFIKHPTYLSNSIKKGLSVVTKKYDPGYKKNNSGYKKNDKSDKSIDEYIEEYNKFKGEKTHNSNYKNAPSCDNYNLNKNYGSGYYLAKKGFVKRSINDDNLYDDKLITPIKIIPQDLIYLNGSEELLLTLSNGSNIEKNIFKTDKSFTSTLNFKIFLNTNLKSNNWFDGNLNDVTGYDKYISGLIKYMKMKRKKAYSRIGWVDGEFLPYSKEILLYNDNKNEKIIIDSFKKSGNFEKWRECIKENLKNDIFRLYMNVSLSSALIELLNLQGFGLYNYAPSNRGKSIAAYAAYSIWGKPDKKTVSSCNVTRAGIESKANTLNNLPLILDDTQQLSQYSKQSEKFIYDLANGSGKSRMTKDAKSGDINFWALTFIFTGERHLLDDKVDGGAFKRLLEINGAPSDDKNLARVTKNIVMNNYGFLGPLFIEFLKLHKDDLIDIINKFEDKLENKRNIEAHITNMAIVSTCDYIMHKILFNQENDSLKWAKRIFKKLPTKKSIDKMENGIELIKETYLSNPARFDTDSNIPKLGFLHEGICFHRNELIKLLKEHDIPDKQFFQFIKDKKFVYLDSNNNFKVVYIKGVSSRPIQFKKTFFKNEENQQQKITDLIKDPEDPEE